MHSAVVRVLSRLGESELEFIVGVEWSRLELTLGTVNGVRDVVTVDPPQNNSCCLGNNVGPQQFTI